MCLVYGVISFVGIADNDIDGGVCFVGAGGQTSVPNGYVGRPFAPRVVAA